VQQPYSSYCPPIDPEVVHELLFGGIVTLRDDQFDDQGSVAPGGVTVGVLVAKVSFDVHVEFTSHDTCQEK